MTLHNLSIFLWGLFFGYIWSSVNTAIWLVRKGYKSIHEIEDNNDN